MFLQKKVSIVIGAIPLIKKPIFTDPPSRRKKRGLGLTSFPLNQPRHDERRAQLRAYRCYFEDCIPPPPPSFPRGEPDKRYRWSNATDWEEIAFKSNGEITK